MKNAMLTILVCVGSILGLGCEEEVKPARVIGNIHFSGVQCGGDFENINGTLAQGGAAYYGYCKKKGNGDFEFLVATADRPKAVNSTDFYLLVRGVVGPPAEGVYDANGQPKDDENLYTTFESVMFKNVNEYKFEFDDPNDFSSDGLCDITLYAKPIKGELNPDKQKFNFYVAMNCGAIEAPVATDDSIVLNQMDFYFYFSDC
jgi:hypothetical protein